MNSVAPRHDKEKPPDDPLSPQLRRIEEQHTCTAADELRHYRRPMLTRIEKDDFNALQEIIEAAVRSSIARTEDDARFLIDDIVGSLRNWQSSGSTGFHRKYIVEDSIAGFIVVKEYWNLSHLFVAPRFQRHGFGRALIEAAVESCRTSSPRGKIQLNSSTYAAPFYEATGFVQTAPPVERAGGCIPFQYVF